MSEEQWVRKHDVQQRRCVVFCHDKEKDETICKCGRSNSKHPQPLKTSEIWSVSKNTVSESCRNFGFMKFKNERTSSKFVRLDAETRMSVVKKLLLDVWNLPDPKWIISVIGDEHRHEGDIPDNESGLAKEKELKSNIETVMSLFSNGQSMWVTTEGINFGVSQLIGQALKELERDEKVKNSLVGIFEWSACTEESRTCLENKTDLEGSGDSTSETPSVLYPHHLLVDDGSHNPFLAGTPYWGFRTILETSLTNHCDESSSMPLVILLYGGWSHVIDGIEGAIDNNVPIVVLKGTGGFADALATLYETSKGDPLNTSTSEHGQKWTGTVIDDRLRKNVQEDFTRLHGRESKDGQYKLLRCLQKRELLTLVNLDDDAKTLAKAISKALLKAKTTQEILRIIDYYMPSRMFKGEGVLSAFYDKMCKGLNEVAGLFLFEAIDLDLSECVQFIIDYEGVNLVEFLKVHKRYFSQDDEKKVEKNEADSYKILLQWAVRNGRQKCAALFWKKGNDLLASALEMAVQLHKMMDTEEHIGKKRELKKRSDVFQQRALGLVDECFNDNRKKTMYLMQTQGADNIWTPNPESNQVLDRCYHKCNRRIFASDAFKRYMRHIRYGKINPPNMATYKRQVFIPETEESKCNKFRRRFLAPVTTFSLNLIFYVGFLVLFGYTLLFELDKNYSPLEGVLVSWWFTFVVEEIRQLWTASVPEERNSNFWQRFGAKLYGYFYNNYWNILDVACLVFFLTGAALMAVYHVDNTREDVYQAARVFLSLDIMFFTWRLLQNFAMNSTLGPVLEMIYEMINDLLPFLVVMLVFVISQGIAAQALLYPDRDLSRKSLFNIPKNAFWNIFGELGLDEFEEDPDHCSSGRRLHKEMKGDCPSTLGQYTVPLLLGMYMLLMNVLLLNILIARFSFTFQKIHEQTTWLAAWQRARVTLEYYKKPPLPPPFNVLFHMGQLLCCCKICCCKSEQVYPFISFTNLILAMENVDVIRGKDGSLYWA